MVETRGVSKKKEHKGSFFYPQSSFRETDAAFLKVQFSHAAMNPKHSNERFKWNGALKHPFISCKLAFIKFHIPSSLGLIIGIASDEERRMGKNCCTDYVFLSSLLGRKRLLFCFISEMGQWGGTLFGYILLLIRRTPGYFPLFALTPWYY